MGVICVAVGALALRAYLCGEGWIHVMFPANDIGRLMVDGVEVKAHQPRNRAHAFRSMASLSDEQLLKALGE